MKQSVLFLLTIIFILVASCNKAETDEINDNIIFKNFNKTIISQEQDSISGTCKSLIFEIRVDAQMEYSSTLKINDELICCDGYNSIITDSDTEIVIPLDEHINISQDANWIGIHDLSLDDFAGKGEKYIGYRSCFYPDGINNYHFGWIKIKLSANKDSLTIISRATNFTSNKTMQTGQIE